MRSSDCTLLYFYTKRKPSFFDQSSVKSILSSVFVTEDEFEDLAKKMDLEEANVDRCAAILDAENRNDISNSLEALSIAQCEKYTERKGQGFNSQGLQIEESRYLILRLIEHYPMTMIIIDALDECDPERRDTLLDTIENLLQESSLGLLKVFLWSRDDQDISCTL